MGPMRAVIALAFGGVPALGIGLVLLIAAKLWSEFERRRSERRLARLLRLESADVRRYAVRSVADPSRHATTLLQYRSVETDPENLKALRSTSRGADGPGRRRSTGWLSGSGPWSSNRGVRPAARRDHPRRLGGPLASGTSTPRPRRRPGSPTSPGSGDSASISPSREASATRCGPQPPRRRVQRVPEGLRRAEPPRDDPARARQVPAPALELRLVWGLSRPAC